MENDQDNQEWDDDDEFISLSEEMETWKIELMYLQYQQLML